MHVTKLMAYGSILHSKACQYQSKHSGNYVKRIKFPMAAIQNLFIHPFIYLLIKHNK